MLVGPSAAGKTTLLEQLVNGEFRENYASTIGIDGSPMMTLGKGNVKVKLYDTPGATRFRDFVNSFYKTMHAVVLVFDLADEDSWEELKNDFLGSAATNGPNAKLFIVGNKADLEQHSGAYRDEIAEIRKTYKIAGVYEVSAKDKKAVDAAFADMAEKMVAGTVEKEDGSLAQFALETIFTKARKRDFTRWKKADVGLLFDRMKEFMRDPSSVVVKGTIKQDTLNFLNNGGKVYRGVVYGFLMDARGHYPHHWLLRKAEKRQSNFLKEIKAKEVDDAVKAANKKGWRRGSKRNKLGQLEKDLGLVNAW